MIQYLFVLRDVKSQTFKFPHFAISKADAVRSFCNTCNNPETDLYKYAEDFAMYLIGELSEEDGSFKSCQPELIMTAIEASKVHQMYYASQSAKQVVA